MSGSGGRKKNDGDDGEEFDVFLPLNFRSDVNYGIDFSRSPDSKSSVYESTKSLFSTLFWQTVKQKMFFRKPPVAATDLQIDHKRVEEVVSTFREFFNISQTAKNFRSEKGSFSRVKQSDLFEGKKRGMEYQYVSNVLIIGYLYFQKLGIWKFGETTNETNDLMTLEEFIKHLSVLKFSESLIYKFIVTFPEDFTQVMEILVRRTLVSKPSKSAMLKIKSILFRVVNSPNSNEYFNRELRSICVKFNAVPGIVLQSSLNIGDLKMFFLSTFFHTKKNIPFVRMIVNFLKHEQMISKRSMEKRSKSFDKSKNYYVQVAEFFKKRVKDGCVDSFRIICSFCMFGVSIFTQQKDIVDLFRILYNPKDESKPKFSSKMMDLFISVLVLSLKFSYLKKVMIASIKEVVKTLWKTNNFKTKRSLVLLFSCIHTKEVMKKFISFSTGIHNVEVDNELDLISNLFDNDLVPKNEMFGSVLKFYPFRYMEKNNLSFGDDFRIFMMVLNVIKCFLPDFRKYKLDSTDWIFNLIPLVNEKVCPKQFPSVLPKVIKGLVESYIGEIHGFKLVPFSESRIKSVMSMQGDNFLPVILILYYVMLVNSNIGVKCYYSTDIVRICNILEIFKYVWKKKKYFGEFTYTFLGLIFENYKGIFHLSLELKSNLVFPHPLYYFEKSVKSVEDFVFRNLRSNILNQPVLKQVFDYVSVRKNSKYDAMDQVAIDFLKILIPHCLNEKIEVEEYLLKSYLNLWEVVCKKDIMNVCLRTFNVLTTAQPDKKGDSLKHHLYSYNDIYRNLLYVFSIDKRIFMIPEMLELFLQVLNHFMVGARKYIMISKGIPNSKDVEKLDFVFKSGFNKMDLKNNIILTEESTIIQCLLEICLLSKDTRGLKDEELLKREIIGVAIQQIICEFIHHRFIENPLLARLIHFQGYDRRLIPVTSLLVSSIHICRDFLVELIQKEDFEMKVFGITLAAHIFKKKNMKDYVKIAQIAVDNVRLFGVLGKCSTDKKIKEYFLELLDPLFLIGSAFPPLICFIIETLNEVKVSFKNDFELHEVISQFLCRLVKKVKRF